MSKWLISLIITIIGVIIALVAVFSNQNVQGIVIGIAIAFVGLAFKPSGKQ